MKKLLFLLLLFPIFAHAQSWQKSGNALQYKVIAPGDTVWAFNLGTPTNNLLSFTPHGGGGGSGTVTTVTGVNANGFTWSIANPTTHPALTLQLQTASTTLDGQLSHTDWNTFNGKLSPTGSAVGLTGLLSSQVTTALGFTPEDAANKATSFGVLNNTLYPTTQAVQDLFNTFGATIYTGDGTLSGNRTVTHNSKYLEFTADNGTSSTDVLFDNTSAQSNVSLQATKNSRGSVALNLQAGSGSEYVGFDVNDLGPSSYLRLYRTTGLLTISDGIGSLGAIYAADYSTNQRLHPLSIASVGTVKLIADSVKATISAGGVTAVTGTTNRITSTGGATPQIDISATFEALLGKVANPLSQFASTTSAQLAGVLSDESGTGVVAYTTNPVFTTPNLGTPSALVGTNITGTGSGFTAGHVTTNANLTGDVTSAGNATTLAATTNSTLTTLSALSLPYSQLTGTPSLASYLTAIGVTTANGVSGTSSGGTTPNLTITLGAITPTSTNGVLAATMAFNDATSSIQTQLNGKQASGSYALQSTTISAGTGLSGGGSLATNRTISADTTVLQTVLNFKPLGSTYWLSKTASTLPSSFTASSLTSFGGSPTLNTAVLTGLPTGTGVSNASTASTLAARDANSNLYANAFHPGFTTTVSSGTPIVLTVASAQVQEITGTTAQTITLPVASTLTTGWTIIITSASSAAITIQSSGGNTVATIQNGNTATLWCVLASGTGLASWDRTVGVGSLSGTSGGGVLSTGATMNTLTLTGTTTTAAITAGASSITGGTVNAVKAGSGTTPNAGIALTNSTNATVGTQNQYGLDLTWTYSAWNTGGTPAANQQQFSIEPRGINGATTGGTIFYKFQNNGGGFTDAYSFNANGNFTALTGTVILHGFTVAALPTGITGMTAYVTDALTPTFGTTVVGGGAVITPVFYNGTNWITY